MARHSPGFVALTEAAKDRIQEITPAELLARWDDADRPVLVDTREGSEWSEGRIPGAVHLSKGVIERDIEEAFPDPATPMVLYCGGGYRSALAAEALGRMGYRRVWSLAGGRRGWLEADGPWTTEPVD